MKPFFDASQPDVEAVNCVVCEKLIMGGRWFARIQRDGWTVALCCPLCAETFEALPRPYLRRVATYAHPPGGP